ncbi:uncharacterized protein B0H18DRAFT_1083842 [Fomitopsis serialis]|uniref:uncharacterized protein n=1 Tax=Fomitopsis serialis TaxID=139415 RepID=UPI0020078E2E|nr:uncharacterized protein B0H18DRAFT_1083842 [Neoantrodia serialis]KAH9930197.1 hypothetical protein B0H18DRAFT_1083842 [Neoantrodia serialis]
MTASGLSSSGGKSWNRPSPLSGNAAAPPLDVNARDWLGRTVLHLAAAAQDAAATEYVRMLLAHSDIQINLTDAESHWTALHRALYHGNLSTAILLLQRPDIDVTLRDLEGCTAFDLYNSTLEGTKPASDDTSTADLLTWGANRNAALGLGNGDDRVYPEQVVVRPPEGSAPSEKETVDARFAPIRVGQVVMSKLHTAVVTSEPRANLRVCGFGSGGRLGPGQHTQYGLVPLAQFSGTVGSVALGQDHTLLVTKSGEVYSWGLNRFSQLGYAVEAADGARGRAEEPIQVTARKVVGPLKNKAVLGVAACKTASACWTAWEVYTWGTNSGQLGYDKSAHPVQILPRVVTKVSQPVVSVTISDTAMACLLSTQDVICLWHDGHFKVNFPVQAFPSEIAAYRPPHSVSNASIEKITSCEGAFAALSSNGELFTFAVPPARTPARVWALRKKITAVKDVALGADGSLIICTESGHVFVRTRAAKPAHGGAGGAVKTHKFAQMPYLQRVVRVCANVTGAYGALRVDYVPPPVKLAGRLVAQDMAEVQPWLTFEPPVQEASIGASSPTDADVEEEVADDEGGDIAIQKDIKHIRTLLSLLEALKAAHASGAARSPFEGHILVQVHSYEVPAHRPSFSMTYLYSDDVPALWDPRVGLALSGAVPALGVRLAQVKQELQALARVLELPALSTSLEAPVKRVPRPTMGADLSRLFAASQRSGGRAPGADARGGAARAVAVFAAFFDEEEWTRKRWTPEGTVVLDLGHLRWREMEVVCRYMCCGGDAEMFDVIEHVGSVDELVDFMFNVMAAASRLVERAAHRPIDAPLLASHLKRVNIMNVCSVLSDASFYHALPLVDSLHSYMAANVETLLESHMLDDLPAHLIKQLAVFVRQQQAHKYPVSRSTRLVDRAMQAHGAWLALQDIPQPVVPTFKMGAFRDSRGSRRPADPVVRPVLAPPPPAQSLPADDEVFVMDDAGPSAPIQPSSSVPEVAAGGWRAISTAPRVDMRAIMAEAEISSSAKRTPIPGPIARKSSAEAPTSFRGTPPKAASFPALPRATSDSPWRMPVTPTRPPVGLPSTPSSSGRADQSTAPRPAATAPSTQPPTPTKKPAGPAGMGPIITPSKKAAPPKDSPGSIRRVSSGSVWTPPPVQPIVQSSTTTGMSFVAIQELQREQAREPAKDKRSLLQIQEEEQARQAEEDFLRWWSAEEARLKAEEQGDRETQGQGKKPRRSRPAKGSAAPDSTSQ